MNNQVCEAPVPDGISHMGSGGSKPGNIRRHDIHYSRPIAQCKDGEKRLQRGCGYFPELLCCDPKMLSVPHRTHCT
jgi:hypothetical protein